MIKSKKFLCLILAMVVLIPNIAMLGNVFAQTADTEPLKIEVTTDKSSYSLLNTAKITVKVTNVSSEVIENVSAEAVFNELIPIGKDSQITAETEKLEAGKSIEFSYNAMLSPNASGVNIFQKILLTIKRFFAGSISVADNGFNDGRTCIEDNTDINFGKVVANNNVKVWYVKNNDYISLIQGVNIDEAYEYDEQDISYDDDTGIYYINKIIIIMFDDDCPEKRKAEIINSINGKVVGGIDGFDELHIEIKKSTLKELKEVCDKLNNTDGVFDASYDELVEYTTSSNIYTPKDPWTAEEDKTINWNEPYSLENWWALAINAREAWYYNKYYSNINIGIVDTGFDSSHEDLNIQVVSKENSVDNHGTHVAGIIGATHDNEKGISGVVENCTLFGYDITYSNDKFISNTEMYEGLEILIKDYNCKVVNFSIGNKFYAYNDKIYKTDSDEYLYTNSDIDKEGKTASKKLYKLINKGYKFIVVQAAGNGAENTGLGQDAIYNGGFCSITKDNCYSNKKVSVEDIMNRIIVVASADLIDLSTSDYIVAASSNGGNQVDIAAPGTFIYSTISNNSYKFERGTSMAAPMVTGVASLVWAVNPNFTASEVKEIVCNSVDNDIIVVDNQLSPCSTNSFRMVNAQLAVEEAIRRTNPSILNTASVGGTVIDSETMLAISNVKATVESEETGTIYSTYTDNNGDFMIKNLPEGNYTLSLSHEDYYEIPSYCFNLTQGLMYVVMNPFNLIKKENKTTSVIGGVIDSETQENISNVKVMLYSEDTQITYTTMTDESGLFIFEDLTAGKYTLSFEHDNYTSNEPYSFTLDNAITFVLDNFELTKKESTEDDTNEYGTLTATGVCGDNATWEYYQETSTLLILGTGDMYNWNYSNVPWSYYKKYIKNIVINEGITSIGDYAFYSCYYLKNIIAPKSITVIGKSAFKDCDELNNAPIPDGVISIGDYAFADCFSLVNVTIPASVVYIGKYTFYNCFYLTGITVDSGNMYYSNDSYGALLNKDKTELIQYFSGTAFRRYTIPSSVTTIGDCAFYDAQALTGITIPNGVEKIGESAFFGCYRLKNIAIPNSVVSIGDYAFYDCNNLTSITISDGVTIIGNYAFSCCKSLASVTIPDSVTSIGDRAFEYCKNLASLTVDTDNQYYSNDSYGVLFNKDKTELIQYPAGSTRTSYTIPEKVTSIGNCAFSYCTSLTSVTIPNSVTSIGSSAFHYCTSLTSVTIPDSVTSIGNHAFSYCTNLECVTISNSITNIGDYAFKECTSLTDVYYSGSKEEWSNISIGNDNTELTNGTLHYNS